jgi:hypothetical protein
MFAILNTLFERFEIFSFQTSNRCTHLHGSHRTLRDGLFVALVPGTCQARHEQAIARRMATIALSLRDVSQQTLAFSGSQLHAFVHVLKSNKNPHTD